MREIFRVVTGTEALYFTKFVSFMQVSCYLEPLDEILTDKLSVGTVQPEHLRLTTFGLYRYLQDGHLNVVQALFVSDENLMQLQTPEYLMLRANRHEFVSPKFFDETVKDVMQISEAVTLDPNLDEQNRQTMMENIIQRKHLAMALLHAAENVAANQSLSKFEVPDFRTVRDIDNYIEDKVEKIKKYRNPKKINRDLLMRIIRKPYIALSKHI